MVAHYDRRELSRRAAGGSRPDFFDDHQDHLRGGRDWRGVFFAGELPGERGATLLAGSAHGRRRDLQRVSCGAGSRIVGLRRLGRSQPCRLRSGKPAEKFPARAGRRSRICRRGLSAVQRGLFESAAVRNRGGIAAHRVRCDRAHQGSHCGQLDHACHGHLRAGLDEFVGAKRSARGLRDGPRRNLFQDRRRHPPEIPHARSLAAFPGRAGKFDGPYRNIRRTYKSLYFCRLDILRSSSGGLVSNAQDRTRSAAPLSLLGLPLGPGPVRGRRVGAHAQYLARTSRPLLDRLAADSRRTSLLPPLEPVALSRPQFAGKLTAAKKRPASESPRQEEPLQELQPIQSQAAEKQRQRCYVRAYEKSPTPRESLSEKWPQAATRETGSRKAPWAVKRPRASTDKLPRRRPEAMSATTGHKTGAQKGDLSAA